MSRRDVFHAIADPTRRAIISMVVDQPLTLNTVASRFSISRPAISRHIRILAECGLVTLQNDGRERYCQANPAALQPIAGWLQPYQRFWNDKLDQLGHFLDTSAPSTRQRKTRRK